MDATTLKIAMAGLFHDIGKFADRKLLKFSNSYFNDNADLYLPSKDGRFTHYHSLCTAAFIEQMAEHLPDELNRGDWGDGESLIFLAAGHHDPKTPMQWLIAIADRVSSGWDRDKYDDMHKQPIPPKEYRKTRLVPIFEQLTTNSKADSEGGESFQYCYPLEALSPTSIFPGSSDQIRPQDDNAAMEEYRLLYNQFTDGLERLGQRNVNVAQWFEVFDSLLMICTSSIPAARVGKVVPDVSLYDHSRMTAAFATAAYLFHAKTDSLAIDSIRNYDDKKFSIINGDFRGIQTFIFGRFGESAKYRSKVLRGRSFAVSLFTELAADLLCREIGLPFTSVILNAAGKFTILAPNLPETHQAVKRVEQKINDWLINIALGETVIVFSTVEASCNDFVTGNFIGLWDQMTEAMLEKKLESIDLNQYGGAVEGYLDSFVVEPGLPPICTVCGKRPSVPGACETAYVRDARSICNICRDHIYLGTNLVKGYQLAIASTKAIFGDNEEQLFEPIFGHYQLSYLKQPMSPKWEGNHVYSVWDLGSDPEQLFLKNVPVKFISGYVPCYSSEDSKDDRILRNHKDKGDVPDQINIGDPLTLNDIACKALNFSAGGSKLEGTQMLGVLKADVDHLGLLLSCGLKEERFTVSRLATISRQLNYFFAVYLPHRLQSDDKFKDVYTVFAGGDDLFLIGPWNTIIKLAPIIDDSFTSYVCNNPEVHLSAGVSLHKPHTPIDSMAIAAEGAIDKAKSGGRNRFTIYSEVAEWSVVREMTAIREKMESWLDRGWVSRVFFYRLNEFIRMAAYEKQLSGEAEIRLSDMACTKWRALLVYSAERNIAKKVKGDEHKKIVQEITQTLTGWLDTYGNKLKIPVWSILYDRR